MDHQPSLSLESALSQMLRIQQASHEPDLKICIQRNNFGGLSAHQTTDVVAVRAGFDWEAGRVILVPAKPLSELSQEQADAIVKSVRSGTSWHAYENDRKLRARIKELEAELQAIKAREPAPENGEES